MFVLNRYIQLSLGNQSRALLPFVSSWSKRSICTSAGIIRYVPRSCAKKASKLQSLDQYEQKDDSLVRTRVSVGGRVGKFPSSSSVPCDFSLHGASTTEEISSESMESISSLDEDGDFSELEEITCNEMDPVEEHDPENVKYGQTREDVQRSSISLLAARAYSAHELRKKLVGKKYPLKIVESVITDLQGRGLLNDSLYAESFSRARWLSLSWGPRRIKRALLDKGISEEDAVNATCHVFQDEGSSEYEQGNLLGLSKHAFDRLFSQASKQWLRGLDKPLQNRKSSIVRWLQYRGFDWAVTKLILKKLETEYPT